MKKPVSRAALGMILIICLAFQALADDLVPEGWEKWSVSESNGKMTFTYPGRNPNIDEVLFYTGKIVEMSEYSPYDDVGEVEIIFEFSSPDKPYTVFSDWVRDEVLMAIESLWPYKGMASGVHTYIRRIGRRETLLLTIEKNSGDENGEFEEYYAKITEIAQAAMASSDSDVDRLRYINRWLVDNVEYEQTGDRSHSAVGAVIDGKAVCEGYMNAARDLCNLMGITNVNIYNKTQDHAWNYVYVGGTWKMLDVTWNDSGGPSERYFLLDEIIGSSGEHEYDEDLANLVKGVALRIADTRKAVSYVTGAGILKGDDTGNLNLMSGLSRAELAVILTRLAGAENEVLRNPGRYAGLCTFTDLPDWVAPYVGYCFKNRLLVGYDEYTYGPADPVTPEAGCTVMLRRLGYYEDDWSYATACQKASAVGIYPPFEASGTAIVRADMAGIIHKSSTASAG